MIRLNEYVFENIVNIFEASKEEIEYAANNEGIHEIGGKCGWWSTAENFNNWLFSDDKRAKLTLKNIFRNNYSDKQIKLVIKKCYDACKLKYGNKLSNITVPFVIFTDNTKKFAIRTNVNNEIDIKSIIEKELGELPKDLDETHTGFGKSAIKGLAFEPILVDALIKFINASKTQKVQNASELDLPENLFKCCEKINDLYNLIDIYKNIDINDLKNYIKTTGQQSTRRQTKDFQIIDQKTFNINQDFKQLKNSGQIIADITCYDPQKENDIYISCKVGQAQLSGITNNSVFYKDGRRDKSHEIFANKNIQKEDKLLDPLKGFCNLLGLNFDKVFEYYKNLEAKNVNKRKLTNYNDESWKNGNGNIDDLKKMICYIIGSNYCYVNGEHPDKIVKIDLNENYLKQINLEMGAVGISDSGRTIKRICKINGQKCFFCFRQSKAAHRYPYRFFIGDLDVYKFIESLK